MKTLRLPSAFLAVIAALAVGGCDKHSAGSGSGGAGGNGGSSGASGGSSSGIIPEQIGQTSFVSQPANGAGGARAGGAESLGAANGQTDDGATPSVSGAGSSSTTRSIVESDIYKVVGNILYAVNTYRGLQIIDMTDLAHPNLIARVPIVGTPVDLYVDGTTAYVIVSDYFYYFWGDFAGGWCEPSLGSQVWAVDVTTPSAPNVLSQLPINGGVTDDRIVGNILYVVSNVYSWESYSINGTSQDLTFVASFDISNPAQMLPVAEQDFPAGGWNIHDNVTTNRIIISESGWDSTSNAEITQFEPIDISDPGGAMVLGTAFTTPGDVPDRWAMDFDPTTNLFRAVTENAYENNGGTLQIWTAPNINTATPTGSLNLNVQESVTAVTYNGPRAYIVTAYCTDPLWIVDTTNPANPVIAGSVQLSGALDFLEAQGNQIVALGHQSSGCNAWEGDGQLAVSLFDVTNPATASLLTQVSFGQGYSVVNVSADDMKKAFQVLPDLGMILVPFQSWNDTTYQYVGGTQFIDLDPTSLVLRGFASHQGNITRAFPVQDKIVAFSDQSLQVIDATNRDAPTTVSQIDLARPVLGLTAINGQVVELSGDWTVGDTELAVTDATTPDQPVPNAVVPIAAPNAQTFVDGNIMWVMSNDYTSSTAWIQGVDLTNPSAPVMRGNLALQPAQVPASYLGWYYWGYGDEAVLVNHTLVIHLAYYGCWGDYCGEGYVNPPDQVITINLSNPDSPTLNAPLTLPDSDWSWGLTAMGNYAWITHYEWVPDGNWDAVSYYLDRIDLTSPSSPQLLTKINVPGVFLAASADGSTIYTQNETYSSTGDTSSTILNELQLLVNDTALLVNTITIPGWAGGAAVNNGFAYVETWNYNSDYSSSQAVLTAINLNGLNVTSSQALASNWAWIMAATGGKIFVQASWNDAGILIYDLSNPGTPLYQGSVRTEGWVENVVVSGNTAYLPSGDYGVPMVDLTPGSQLQTTL